MNPRQHAGQKSAQKQRELLAMDEGSVKARFGATLIDDPETKERYYRYLADYSEIKSTYGAAYRGLVKR